MKGDLNKKISNFGTIDYKVMPEVFREFGFVFFFYAN